MAFVAWRLLRQNSDRRAARVEALQSLADVATMEPLEQDLRYSAVTSEVEAPAAHFFEAPERLPASRWQRRLAVVLGVAALGAVPYAMYQMGAFKFFSTIATAAPAGDAQPLELMSLRHTTDDHGAFTVTGLVQNPAGGRKTSGLIAVVYLFDDAGRFMATGRAAVDVPTLQAGEEASFTVTIPKVTGVSRYRVGFRLSEGGVVGHVDRRGQPATGTTEDAVGTGRGRTTEE
jgi:hypothetical protein